MAIEGPLRELGLHDVFQLLDLSRKTGALRVTSGLRDNEGMVYFDAGQVVYASVRSNPHPLGAMLVRSRRISEAELANARTRQQAERGTRRLGQVLVDEGLISARELDRQLRLQIEAVAFELLSWREGFFSFTEQDVSELPADAMVRISAESLLMEAARRMDEFSAIADRVPSLDVVPALAGAGWDADPDGDAPDGDAPGVDVLTVAPLDLRQDEWEVLAAVDGERDLRSIAVVLGRSEFDVAKVAARLVRSRVIAVASAASRRAQPTGAGLAQVARSAALLVEGDAEGALAEARLGVAADPGCVPAHLAVARSLERLGRSAEALETLRRAAQVEGRDPELQRTLGFALARAGHLPEAVASWRICLRESPASPSRDVVAEALDAAKRLHAALEAHAQG